MRMLYPTLQNATLDRENGDHHIIPGAWRDEGSLADMEEVIGGNRESRQERQQGFVDEALFQFLCFGSVTWQMDHVMADE